MFSEANAAAVCFCPTAIYQNLVVVSDSPKRASLTCRSGASKFTMMSNPTLAEDKRSSKAVAAA